jgi:hypothetical protein
MARSFSSPPLAPQLSVDELLLLRQRIVDRASVKLEKRHSAVDARRHDRVPKSCALIFLVAPLSLLFFPSVSIELVDLRRWSIFLHT